MGEMIDIFFDKAAENELQFFCVPTFQKTTWFLWNHHNLKFVWQRTWSNQNENDGIMSSRLLRKCGINTYMIMILISIWEKCQ